jgi:hypothetical protein
MEKLHVGEFLRNSRFGDASHMASLLGMDAAWFRVSEKLGYDSVNTVISGRALKRTRRKYPKPRLM